MRVQDAMRMDLLRIGEIDTKIRSNGTSADTTDLDERHEQRTAFPIRRDDEAL